MMHCKKAACSHCKERLAAFESRPVNNFLSEDRRGRGSRRHGAEVEASTPCAPASGGQTSKLAPQVELREDWDLCAQYGA